MDEATELSDLIGGIYDAALEPSLWPGVLGSVRQFIGGCAAGFGWKDAASRTAAAHYHDGGLDPGYFQLYLKKYAPIDPITTSTLFMEVEEPFTNADIISPSEFFQTRLYREWAKPQGLVDFVAALLDKSITSYAFCYVYRSADDGMADDQARRRMRLIAPHVRRAVLIGKVIDLHKVEAAQLADTLDGVAAGVVLVDAAGRIVHANAAGLNLIAEGAVLHALGGKLACDDAAAEETLYDLFINAERGDAAIGKGGIAVSMSARDGERYVAHVLPLTSGARRKAGVAYSAVAAVFVRKAGLEAPHPVEAIANAFRLTPAEMRVLMMIVQLGGVSEVAPVLGISETTVKTHLQHVFDKTGMRRQADLVKLVAGYMNPLAK
jgi:DNA-binding CsgD family transcriptional regulator